MDDLFIGLILFGIILFFYFLPWYIAFIRGHHQTVAIFVLNLLTGWTTIGWIAAMVWACTQVRRPYMGGDDLEFLSRRTQ